MKFAKATCVAVSIPMLAVFLSTGASASEQALVDPETACLTGETSQGVVYSDGWEGAVLVGDGFASTLVPALRSIQRFGDDVILLSDDDLTPQALFDPEVSADSLPVRVRNTIATAPSAIIIAFENSSTVNVDTVSRIAVLAGERDLVWITPPGASEDDMRARADLMQAENVHPNITLVSSRTPLRGLAGAGPYFVDEADADLIANHAAEQLANITPKLVTVSPECEEANPVIDDGQLLRAKAVDFALKVVNSATAKYTYSSTTSPFASPYPYNCSTLTAAAYRYASDDQVQLVGFSDSQLWDMANIELVPWEEAQPGDIFFQKTMDDRFLGHVGMLLEKDEYGGGTVIHACGDDGWCANAPAYGMGYTDISRLSGSGLLTYPLNSSLTNVSRKGNIGFTSSYQNAWYGRVKAPSR